MYSWLHLRLMSFPSSVQTDHVWKSFDLWYRSWDTWIKMPLRNWSCPSQLCLHCYLEWRLFLRRGRKIGLNSSGSGCSTSAEIHQSYSFLRKNWREVFWYKFPATAGRRFSPGSKAVAIPLPCTVNTRDRSIQVADNFVAGSLLSLGESRISFVLRPSFSLSALVWCRPCRRCCCLLLPLLQVVLQ